MTITALDALLETARRHSSASFLAGEIVAYCRSPYCGVRHVRLSVTEREGRPLTPFTLGCPSCWTAMVVHGVKTEQFDWSGAATSEAKPMGKRKRMYHRFHGEATLECGECSIQVVWLFAKSDNRVSLTFVCPGCRRRLKTRLRSEWLKARSVHTAPSGDASC
jgi:hypothetical protein